VRGAVALLALALVVPARRAPSPEGEWRAALDLAGGELRFGVTLERRGSAWEGELCNGSKCQPFSAVSLAGDSVALEMADYAAAITAKLAGDSLTGAYRNVGNRGPRVIPFRASRGRWQASRGSRRLIGRWDATWVGDFGTSPRVIELRDGTAGLEGTIISNTGDYGHFAGQVKGDTFSLAHFDGSYVYLLTGALSGGGGTPDTLRGLFHAGLRTQTPWIAVRSTGAPHLRELTENTQADTTEPFRFAFPDLDGRLVTERDPRFKNKVVMVDVFGTWCPTCHDAAPELVRLHRKYRKRGLEIVGLAYEVSGDTSVDRRQVRRYREKFGIPFPLLLAGVNDTEAAAATLPQLQGFTSFPTTIFLGRDGKVRRIHAGFYGPATGAQHAKQVKDWAVEVERLLRETREEKREE
jgi:thiol-disulfide isomerase/thioredoxin